MISRIERNYLFTAITLAKNGVGHTRPNPPVGAVVVKDGAIIGRGWHKKAGEDHAEVIAMNDARANGFSLNGSQLYVSLEPCSKPGKVGACTDAIAEAGISRVVYVAPDPNPKNHDCARIALSKAGIECESVRDDALLREAKDLLRPFEKHVLTGLPYVTVKLAMSLDGKICDDFGRAKWISCEESRKITCGWRHEADAIMVGAETVRKDDPSLLPHDYDNPDLIRVVVSKSGELPKSAQVFADGKNETVVFDNPETAVRALGERGCLHVLCEGGLKLARSLAHAGLVDEWCNVMAPIVIGSEPIERAVRFEGEDHVYRVNTKSWNR